MTIFLVFIFLSFLILIHEAGHFFAAKIFGLRVEEFGFGFPPRLFSKKKGETLYSFNLLPLGGFVKIYGENPVDREERSFSLQPAWKRLVVIAAGISLNFIVGWFLLSAVLMIGASPALIISDVQADSPAAAVGLLGGDKIVRVASAEEVFEAPIVPEEFTNFVNRFQGSPLMLTVERNKNLESFEVTPRVNPPEGQGAIGIGIFAAGIEAKPFFASILEGFKASVQTAVGIATAIYRLAVGLFTSSESLEGVTGPVGIFTMAIRANGIGFVYLLHLIGLISINLAVLNFIPFPALDGGRIFFILLEKLKGAPLRPRFEQFANVIGFLILLSLMVFVTLKDIAKLLF